MWKLVADGASSLKETLSGIKINQMGRKEFCMGTHIDNQALEKFPLGFWCLIAEIIIIFCLPADGQHRCGTARMKRSFWHTGMQGFLMVYIREIWIGYFRIYRRCLTERRMSFRSRSVFLPARGPCALSTCPDGERCRMGSFMPV